MQIAADLVDVLRERSARPGCREHCIDIATLLRHLEDSVQTSSEVTLIATLPAIATAKADSNDIASLVDNARLDLVKDETVFERFDAMHDLGRAAESEDSCQVLCTCFQESRLATASGDAGIVDARFEILGDDDLDRFRGGCIDLLFLLRGVLARRGLLGCGFRGLLLHERLGRREGRRRG